jgi:hypothetical protein
MNKHIVKQKHIKQTNKQTYREILGDLRFGNRAWDSIAVPRTETGNPGGTGIRADLYIRKPWGTGANLRPRGTVVDLSMTHPSMLQEYTQMELPRLVAGGTSIGIRKG